ncbi:MAG TPA: serpin family protein [Phycisphaerae bacterium]|nr:serpin family protein [Phycisphaerae bacterium]
MDPSVSTGQNFFGPLEPRLMLSGDAAASPGDGDVSTPPVVDASGSNVVVQVGVGAARGVRYVDSDGTAVTVRLRKGWASLRLTGDGLEWSGKRGIIDVHGDGVELAEILLRDTSAASRLNIRTNKAGDGLSTLEGLFGSSPLGGLLARRTDLAGDGIVLSGDGTIGVVTLHDLTDGADVVLPSEAGKGVQLTAGRIGDGSDVQIGSAVRKLRVDEWLDEDPDADLVTGRVDRLWVRGDFGADMALAGDSPGGATLGNAYIGGDRVSSDWWVVGPVGPVVIKGRTLVGDALSLGAVGDVAADASQLVAGSNALAWDLYHEMVGVSGSGNILFSPVCVSMALSMAYAGAAGETAAQIADVAGFGLEGDRVHAGMQYLINQLDSKVSLGVFNGVWTQDIGAVQRRYAELLGACYSTEMGVVDFQRNPTGARNSINRQVRTLTGGAIPAVFGPGDVDRSTTLALSSNLGWNVEWAYPFTADKSQSWKFTSLDGRQKSVSMMSAMSDYYGIKFVREWNYTAVELLDKTHDQSMIIVLPDKRRFEAVEAQLSQEMIDSIANYDPWSSFVREVHVTIPRFRAQYSGHLGPALQSLGISDAFTPGAADFSGIDGTGQGGLSLGKIAHEAVVDLAEAGGSGSTSTAASGRLESRDGGVSINLSDFTTREFVADRPFIYVIREVSTNTILFVGRVTDAAGAGFKSASL